MTVPWPRSQARGFLRRAAGGALALLGVVASGLVSPTLAAEEGAWEYEFTPYAWAAGLDGRVGLTGLSTGGVPVEQSFSDILDRLDLGLMGALEARKGRWGLMFDGVYFSLSDKAGLSGPIGAVELAGKATITQQAYALAGTYRAVDEGGRLIDLVGGLRYNSVQWDVKLDLSVPVMPDGTRRINTTERWVDPYFGARVQQALGKRWSLVGYADIGGYGIGSDLSWQLLAGANYAFKPNLVGKLGYRHVQNDYEEDGFLYDMASAGFYLGLGVRW